MRLRAAARILRPMKANVTALILMLAAPLPVALPGPAFAQEAAEEEEGFDLMQEGAKLLFRGLMAEMEPAITEMGKALQEVEPAMKELLSLIDDLRNYDSPRVLPNGDILIPRRKTAPALPESALPEPEENSEIEL